MSRLTNMIQSHATRKKVVTVKSRGQRQTSRLIAQYVSRGYRLESQTRATFGANVLTFVKHPIKQLKTDRAPHHETLDQVLWFACR